jgi:Tol biopolymer transport system component
LHRLLWPADTFVDFDQGLNNAIKRIREVLNDSSESPRYIETLPRLGYRFIGTIVAVPPAPADPALDNHSPLPLPAPAAGSGSANNPPAHTPARRIPLAWILLGALAATSFLFLARLFRPYYPPPRVTAELQLTTDGIPKWGTIATDGLRVYYTERLNDRETIAAVPISGGQAVPLRMPFAQAGLFNISPDRNDLLVAETPDMFAEAPLWRVPVIGGTPRRLGSVAAHDASWSPDGTRLAYTVGATLFVARADGSDPRLLPTPRPEPNEQAWRPTWSADSRRLRFDFYQMDTHGSRIWEINADGTNLHPVFAPSTEWTMQSCGEWTPDGNYFVFSSWKDLESGIPWPAASLWAVRESENLFHRNSALPTILTTGPNRFFVHTLSPDGRTIFALSSTKHGELVRYDARTKTFSPWASGLSAEGVAFSHDGKWVAYAIYPQGELWRSRIDGSDLLRLTSRPLFVTDPVWSPDDRQIAFTATRAGEHWRPYTVSAQGGDPQLFSAIGEKSGDVSWSSDGSSFAYLDKSSGDENTIVKIRNPQTGATSPLAGSRGVWAPRLSPDGRWIAALSNNLRKLLLFDLRTRTSKELASVGALAWPHWTSDSKTIYFSRWDSDPAIFRVSVAGGKPERVVSLKDFRTAGVIPAWFSLTPAGDLLLLHDTGGGTEIYALSWDAP